jgi:hypothetical protein
VPGGLPRGEPSVDVPASLGERNVRLARAVGGPLEQRTKGCIERVRNGGGEKTRVVEAWPAGALPRGDEGNRTPVKPFAPGEIGNQATDAGGEHVASLAFEGERQRAARLGEDDEAPSASERTQVTAGRARRHLCGRRRSAAIAERGDDDADALGASDAEFTVGATAAGHATDRCDEVKKPMHTRTVTSATDGPDISRYPAAMRRRVVVGALTAVLAIVAAAVVYLFVLAPAGANSAEAAVGQRIGSHADANSTRVLVKRKWGDGELVLAGFAHRAERRLALAFVIERRGWHVSAYTERTAQVSDVVVGSLLIARSTGGSGQPAWSAAVGELNDPRVRTVEVSWSSGDPSSGQRENDAYLVVRRGRAEARQARYLDAERVEIARVPIAAGT